MARTAAGTRETVPNLYLNYENFTEVPCRPEGPGRSGIDFGRKVNPTSVATAREAARYLDPTNESTYIHIQQLTGSANGSPVHGWQRYLPSWRVQAEENLVIKFVPAS